MTTKKAAALVGCSIPHLNHLIRKGKIKAKQIPSDSNHLGYRWDVCPKSAKAYADAPLPNHGRGWPRGQSYEYVD